MEAIPGNISGQNLTPAYNFLPVAQKFGMKQIAYASMSEDNMRMTIEYLPEGQTVDNWKRMFTVTLSRASNEEHAALEQLEKVIANMEEVLKQGQAEIHTFDKAETPSGPTVLMHFTMQGEENAGVIMRSPGFIKIMQIATRGESLTQSDMDEVQKLEARVYEAPAAKH